MSGGPCPLCGRTDTRRGFGDLEHCRGCGHRFDPRVVASAIPIAAPTELYGEAYFQGSVYRDYLGEAAARTTAFAEKLSLIASLLPEDGSVLDVGCAAGYFLALMRQRGYRVWGVDLSEFAAHRARRIPGAEIVVGQLAEAGFPPGSFDLVACWDTLEHLWDPVGFLREAHRLLKDPGLLLVETLNTGTLSRLVLGRRWPLLAPPYHLHYFSRRSMVAMLGSEGFRIRRAVPVQTYLRAGRQVRTWRYHRSRLLRGSVGLVAADVVLYAAVKAPG